MKIIPEFEYCPILGQRYFNIVTLPYIAPKGKKRKNKNKWNRQNY